MIDEPIQLASIHEFICNQNEDPQSHEKKSIGFMLVLLHFLNSLAFFIIMVYFIFRQTW